MQPMPVNKSLMAYGAGTATIRGYETRVVVAVPVKATSVASCVEKCGQNHRLEERDDRIVTTPRRHALRPASSRRVACRSGPNRNRLHLDQIERTNSLRES